MRSELERSRDVVLVVDDEPCVLSCLANILLRAGFEVLKAASPDEALQIAAQYSGRIALLVSDVAMPGMSGPRLVDCFQPLHPETQVLFIAGLPDHPEVIRHVVAHNRPFLPKPFNPDTLLGKVRQVLAAG